MSEYTPPISPARVAVIQFDPQCGAAQREANVQRSLGLIDGVLPAYALNPASPFHGSGWLSPLWIGQALASAVGIWVWRRRWPLPSASGCPAIATVTSATSPQWPSAPWSYSPLFR